MNYERICVIGLGYIGLPTASIMATKGFQVHGVEVNQHAVDTINAGSIHIHEPDLDLVVKSAVLSGRLKASTTPAPADVFILAVPTPFRESHKPDMAFVEAASRSIAPHVRPGNLIILESTSPVGSTEQVMEWIHSLRPDLIMPVRGTKATEAQAAQVCFAHCPERVLPGQILKELVGNDRVIGGIDAASAQRCEQVYSKFVTGALLLTDARTAELCKLCENAYRDVNIAYANELSMICERLDIDAGELISLANHHPRVKILQPGPGVGGHCIAVDPWFIVDSAPEQAKLIRCAREVNDSKPHFVVEKILKNAAKLKDPVIACFGLAFKPDVDDLRESPSVEIVQMLAQKNVGRILVVEPFVKQLPKAFDGFQNVKLTDVKEALETANIAVMLVNHRQFLEIDRQVLEGKILVDTRGRVEVSW